ncbi:MAG TPA: thiamine pyrophosphate-dependent enzyme [Acidobacteriaceae bacterium]|jgi:TPP-dependent pyruvate/acetoin dehydrogenase alpha subunit
MMADGADAGAAWENPLIPNARLRKIYLAMLRARALSRALPSGRGGRGTLGIEACLASTAVDLGPADLVSDALGGGVIDFLRGAALGEAMRPGSAKKRGPVADCGAAVRLAAPAGIADRLWAAMGAAAALKTAAANTKAEAKANGAAACDSGVVMVYALPEQVPAALWRQVLAFAHAQELPVLFALLPPKRTKGGKTLGRVSDIALRCGMPGIPVDADDAVAIYRVAQESIGHARIGGGAALIECVPFVAAGASSKRADAIDVLEGYLVERRVATRSWMDSEAKSFAKRLTEEQAASK